MKRLMILLLLLALPFSAACAETESFAGRVRENLPVLTITVTVGGVFDENSHRPSELTAHIAAADGSLVKEVVWRSNETPNRERAAALVMLMDFNFDGYHDLQLLTAAGARNVFYSFALWNPLNACFDPVMTLDGEPLELCNPVHFYDRQEILSVVEDGFRWRVETVIGWDTPRVPVRRVVAEVYDAGDNLIGERLTVYDEEPRILWDHVFEEAWYYDGDHDVGAHGDRAEAIHRFTYDGDALTNPRMMQVANVEWVNLRFLDSKASYSLAKLDCGTEVQVLKEGCGEDDGWVLVWVSRNSAGMQEDETEGMTGYIWHSFLN